MLPDAVRREFGFGLLCLLLLSGHHYLLCDRNIHDDTTTIRPRSQRLIQLD